MRGRLLGALLVAFTSITSATGAAQAVTGSGSIAVTAQPGGSFSLSLLDGVDPLGSTAQGMVGQTPTVSNRSVKVGGSAYATSEVETAVIGQDGSLTWSGLPDGVYLVAGIGAVPFLAPIPSLVNGVWTYQVTATPKQLTVGIAQQVDDAHAHTSAGMVTWTVPASVPHDTASITSFVVAEKLDARLTTRSTRVRVLQSDGSAAPSVVRGQDYVVDEAPSIVTVSFDEVGSAKLPADGTVQLEVDTTPSAGGILTTVASLAINGTELTHASATTAWGELQVSASDSQTAAPLSGAAFDVRVSMDDPEPLTRLETGGDGKTTPLLLKAGTYWLTETSAPQGYEKPASPIEVTVQADTELQTTTVTHISTEASARSSAPTGVFGTLAVTGFSAWMLLGASACLLALALLALIPAHRRTTPPSRPSDPRP